MGSPCHPRFTATSLSYRFPILKLPRPPCAVLLVRILVTYMITCKFPCHRHALQYATLRYVTLYYIALRYVALYYIASHCVTLLRYRTRHGATLHSIPLHYIYVTLHSHYITCIWCNRPSIPRHRDWTEDSDLVVGLRPGSSASSPENWPWIPWIYWDILGYIGIHWDLPSGKLTVCYWTWPLNSLIYPLEMVSFWI